jgi:O-methyltransferase involved in polyketide biosynthesis
MTPEQIADLLKQVTQLTATNKNLLTENNNFKAQQQQKERETMGREQALEQDLAASMETIQKLDAALKNQAILNAINSFTDIQFHDPRFVMHELSADVMESMEVNLDAGTVTINGIENELRRIAREKDWAVKKNNVPTANSGQGSGPKAPPRGSGSPPPPPSGANDKASRRAALIDKFPVIAHGTR